MEKILNMKNLGIAAVPERLQTAEKGEEIRLFQQVDDMSFTEDLSIRAEFDDFLKVVGENYDKFIKEIFNFRDLYLHKRKPVRQAQLAAVKRTLSANYLTFLRLYIIYDSKLPLLSLHFDKDDEKESTLSRFMNIITNENDNSLKTGRDSKRIFIQYKALRLEVIRLDCGGSKPKPNELEKKLLKEYQEILDKEKAVFQNVMISQ